MIGLFFGSFDPPHIGHLNVVETALSQGIVDYISVIPAYQNPTKPKSTPYDIRLNMCRTLFCMCPLAHNIEVWDIEGTMAKDDTEYIYTYEVLKKLETRFPKDECKIITTEETWKDVKNWKNFQEAMQSWDWEIFGYNVANNGSNWHNLDVNLDIHSTNVRSRIVNGINPDPLISSDVYDIIKENKLYGYK